MTRRCVPIGRSARCAGWVIAALSLPACGGAQLQKMDAELQDLRDEVDDLKRSQAASRVQYEELRSRLVLMEDRAESRKVAESRQTPVEVPELPTVRVGEARSARSADADRDAEDRDASHEDASYADGDSPDDPDPADASTGPQPSPRNASGPAGPRPPNDGAEPAEVDPAVSLYERAKQALDAGELKEARAQFDKLLQRYPDHDMADNALYWLGESWYAEARYLQAAQLFIRVAKEYPRGNKVPDALFKLGRCYEKLGDRSGALETWRQLQRSFPSTPAGKLAAQELRRLGT